jgi:hypothetical protein
MIYRVSCVFKTISFDILLSNILVYYSKRSKINFFLLVRAILVHGSVTAMKIIPVLMLVYWLLLILYSHVIIRRIGTIDSLPIM